ncbi:MAG TPA: outer membrane lipoprotein carrier protein LolA [Candidatus Acidoferrales bacterium]|nr:outer membrane lipoprotein carrier protein LolA [Candidatus Acidoferrales bacterium]
MRPGPDAGTIVHSLEARYHSAKTLKAVFLERYSEGRNSVRAESGTAYFSRPGRMRWEYESPESKLFLSDGRTVWFYVPSDHTVTRAPVKESTDWRTPLALLTGKADIRKLCSKVEIFTNPSGAKSTDVTLSCTPRGLDKGSANQNSAGQPLTPGSSGDVRQILLVVDPATSWLSSVLIRQTGGVELEYRFGNWEENLPLQEALFHFAAPKGVAIVDATAISASGR